MNPVHLTTILTFVTRKPVHLNSILCHHWIGVGILCREILDIFLKLYHPYSKYWMIFKSIWQWLIVFYSKCQKGGILQSKLFLLEKSTFWYSYWPSLYLFELVWSKSDIIFKTIPTFYKLKHKLILLVIN